MPGLDQGIQEKSWEDVFIAVYAASRSVRLACERAGVSRQKFKDLKESSPTFAFRLSEALEDHFDILYENLCKQANRSPIVALELAKAQVSWLAPKPPPKAVIDVHVKMEPNEILSRWNESLGITN